MKERLGPQLLMKPRCKY